MSEFYADEADYWIPEEPDLDNDIQWSKYGNEQRKELDDIVDSATQLKEEMENKLVMLQKQIVDLYTMIGDINKINSNSDVESE